MKRVLGLCLVIAIFMVVFIGQAADKPRYEVNVHVQCKDENRKAFIESHIKRELRSLGDVDVDSMFGLLKIRIIALEPGCPTGRKTGEIIVSHLFLEQISSADFIENVLPSEIRATV